MRIWRVSEGCGKPQFKPKPRNSTVSDGRNRKTTPNVANNLGAGGKTFSTPDLCSAIAVETSRDEGNREVFAGGLPEQVANLRGFADPKLNRQVAA